MSDLTLSFVGDIYATRPTIERWRADPSRLDVPRALMGRADLRFANLEAPLLDNGRPLFSTGVRLSSPTATLELLRDLGVNVVSVANNHMHDFGRHAIVATRRLLSEGGVQPLGAGRDLAEAAAPTILTARGRRVGFIAACDDEGGGATATTPGVSLLHPRSLLAAVRRLCRQVDYVVVSAHTGVEFLSTPEPCFRDLAHDLIAAGANIVVGHHPHVPQGIERVGRGLVAYSLGDFLFDLRRPAGDLNPRQAAFNSVHTQLEVELADGGVVEHRVHWLGRDADGRYQAPYAPPGLDWPAEFAAMCAVLGDRDELQRRARSAYRAFFRENVYDAPIHFYRRLGHGGSRHLRGFLWALSVLRRAPKRRQLLGGAAGWCQHVAARLMGGRNGERT